MTMDENRGELRIDASLADSAYLFQIDINRAELDLLPWKREAKKAKHYADVCVMVDGETREFTLDQFATLLGFEAKQKET